MKKDKVRIDQWLHAVRIFKTRSQAANACQKNKITINGAAVKPSHTVKIDEIVEVKSGPITRTFKVTGLIQKRVSAKIAAEMVEETTPLEEFEKLRAIRTNPFALRERGAGRPTKKERRDIDLLKEPWDYE